MRSPPSGPSVLTGRPLVRPAAKPSRRRRRALTAARRRQTMPASGDPTFTAEEVAPVLGSYDGMMQGPGTTGRTLLLLEEDSASEARSFLADVAGLSTVS